MADQNARQDKNQFPALIAHTGTAGTSEVVRLVADSAGALTTTGGAGGGTTVTVDHGSVVVTAGTVTTTLGDLQGGTIDQITNGSIVVTAGTVTTTLALDTGTITTIAAGTQNTLGTVGVVNNLAGGTITKIEQGSVQVTAGTIGGKAASGVAAVANPVLTAGTDSGGTVYSPLVTTTGHQLIDVLSGTLQSSGTTTGVGVVTSVSNLVGGTIGILTNGTISSSGTTTGVGVVSALTTGTIGGKAASGVAAVANPVLTAGTDVGGTVYAPLMTTTGHQLVDILSGTIQSSGTTTGVGVVTSVTNLAGGTITKLEQGSVQVTAGTIASVGTVPGIGIVTRIGNIGTIESGTVTTTMALNTGTITTIAAGTQNTLGTVGVVSALTTGTIGGKAASGAVAVANPVLIGGTDAGGTVYAALVDTSGKLQTTTTLGDLSGGTIDLLSAGTIDTIGALPDLPGGTLDLITAVSSITNLAAGTITRVEGGTITVTNPGGAGTQYAEDTAHVTGDAGMMMLGVANTGGTAFSIAGDYTPIAVDTAGKVYVGTVNTVDAVTSVTNLAAGTITSLEALPDLPGGTVDLVTAVTTVSNVSAGSIAVTAGTVNVTAFGADLPGGTIDLITAVSSVTNLVSGTLLSSGTTTGVGVVSSVTNLAAGTITKLEGGTVNLVSGVTTLTTLTGSGLAHDAIDSGNPHKIGGRAQSSEAQPDEVADNDRVDALFDRSGYLRVRGDFDPSFADINDAVSGDNTIIAAQAAGKRIAVWAILVVSDGTTDVRWEDGAAGTPFTGQVPLQAREGYSISAGGLVPLFVGSAATLLNMELTAAINVHGFVSYTVIDD